jgi:cytoskeletal protein RodZ
MAEDRWDGHPEEFLAGADRPRALPAALRVRLEATLAAAATDAAAAPQIDEVEARPLSSDVRDRLEESLRPAPRTWVRRPMGNIGLAAAAIVVVAAAGLAVGGLVHRSPSTPSATYAISNHALSQKGKRSQAGHASPAPLRRAPTERTARLAPAKGAAPAAPASTTWAPAVRPSAPPSTVILAAGPRGGKRSATTAGVVGGDTVTTTAGAPRRAPVPAPGGASNAQVVRPALVVDVRPDRGSAEGGNWVVVSGLRFAQVKAVDFGGVPAPRFYLVSVAELKALAPAHMPGSVHVVVVTESGASEPSARDSYSFAP